MKAKNGKSLSAQCAGAGVRRECAYTRERAGRVSEAGEQNGNEGRGTERKGGGRALKKRGLGGKTREEGKESPQVFDL